MTNIKKILAPTDLSEYARHALTYASELASTHGAVLHLLYVVDTEWLVTYGGVALPYHKGTILERIKEEGKKGLQKLRKEIKGIEVETTVVIGSPHVEIARFSRENDIDLRVYRMTADGVIYRAAVGEPLGSLITRCSPTG